MTRAKRKGRLGVILAVAVIAVLAAGLLWHGLDNIQKGQASRALAESQTGLEDALCGIDVSSYQEEIDWKGMAKEGFSFAFIKASEGSSHVDPAFKEHWKKAHAAGLACGAYHFLSFDTEGASQAENFIDTVPKGFGFLGLGSSALPPAVDIEMYGDYETAPPTQQMLDDVLQPMLSALEDHYGRTPVLYTNPYLYEQYLSGKYDDYPIWISDPEMSDSLPDGRDWTICQYTFEGSSPYVDDGAKDLDLNVFRGSLRDLKGLK